MPEEDYDLAGFYVGVVDKKDMITGENLKPCGCTDLVWHPPAFTAMVFSLVRKRHLEKNLTKRDWRPTMRSWEPRGGFYENVPRMLKDGVRAVIKKDSYQIPPIFGMLAKKGDIEEHMMYNTYNMGIGMVVAVDAADAECAMEAMKSAGDTPYIIGSIEAGEKGVTLC